MKQTENLTKEIQSLIDVYNSDIIKLKEYFKDSCSALTLAEILVLKRVVTNLENILNKQDLPIINGSYGCTIENLKNKQD